MRAKLSQTLVVTSTIVLLLGCPMPGPTPTPVTVSVADQTVQSGARVTLTSSVTGGTSGATKTYLWQQLTGTPVVLDGAQTATAGFNAPATAIQLQLTFRLQVTAGTSGTDDVVVTVLPVAAPTSGAGPDQTVDEGANVTLAGAGTGLNITVAWSQVGGPAVTLTNSGTFAPTFTAPAVDAATVLTFRLTITDAGGRIATDDVAITVNNVVTQFQTGLLLNTPAATSLVPQAFSATFNANIPAAATLQPLPPVRQQGSLGSCAAFATAYAGATYAAWQVANSDLNQQQNQASPAYQYNKALAADNLPCGEGGTYMLTNLNLLVRDGCPSWQTVPYSDQCLLQPPSNAGAQNFKVGSFKKLTGGRQAIKTEIAEGRIVVFGTALYNDFFTPGPGVYRGNGVFLGSGEQHAGHAMAVVGYDDAKGAYRIMNSWGTEWGDAGFLDMAYETFETTTAIFNNEIYSLTPRNVPGPDGDDDGNGGGGGGGGAGCSDGFSPAINNASVCCPNGYGYVHADGYCYTTPEESGGTCEPGFEPARNNPEVCCPTTHPYDGGDGFCHQAPPDGNCAPGFEPARNQPSVCCPQGFPYFGDDGFCYVSDPNPDTCSPGYSPALNNADVCCPAGYPYDGFDGYCYDSPPAPETCSPGFAPALNNPGVCCPYNAPYDGFDGFCYEDIPGGDSCGPGFNPALNNTSICCPSGFPFYWNDGLCHSDPPNDFSNCVPGYAPAVNNAAVCCPLGYPYFGADGFCHVDDPSIGGQCSPGFAPAVNNPATCCPIGYPFDGFDGYCYTSFQTGGGAPSPHDDSVDFVDPVLREPAGTPARVSPASGNKTLRGSARVAIRAEAGNARYGQNVHGAAPGSGRIFDVSARQVITVDDHLAGDASVKLVFEGTLIAPIRMQQVSITDPQGVEITQDYHVPFGNGYVWFERTDGWQWRTGQYTLRFSGENRDGESVTYTARVTVPAASVAIAKSGGEVGQVALLEGEAPTEVRGDNGYDGSVR